MNGSAITKLVLMSSFVMMVWEVLLVRKSVGAVKEVVMHVRNVWTVMMGSCCDAKSALSPYTLAMLCITLRYDHSESYAYNSFLIILKKWNGIFFQK